MNEFAKYRNDNKFAVAADAVKIERLPDIPVPLRPTYKVGTVRLKCDIVPKGVKAPNITFTRTRGHGLGDVNE